MIAVPVRGDQMIDLLKPCVSDRFHDATRIARSRGACVARID